ncbi:MAG: glycosyltransferase [Candidatus Aminicenantes bacterium]|jgi:glycosyltransferase involved in cell wall biosynthesis
MRIDQLVPAFHRGDAIGDTAFHMKQFFLSQGLISDIYCLTRDSGVEGQSRLFTSFPEPDPEDITILHFALPSPLTEAFKALPSRKVMIYHNITPHTYFEGFSQEMVRIARLGREELKSLSPHVELSLADSEYNRQELAAMDFQRTEVFPLFIDYTKYEKPASDFIYSLFDDSRLNILFVGRIVPNKRIDALIKVLFYCKKYISPLVRLIIVGKTNSLPKYFESLVRLADEFYLKPEEIRFTGHIPDEEMFALYKVADVFLSLSEHEGFGLPFVESMIFDLPIIAFNSTAVPYTLGDSGVLINNNECVDKIGELIYLVAQEETVRKRVITSQRRQLDRYKKTDMREFLLKSFRSISE